MSSPSVTTGANGSASTAWTVGSEMGEHLLTATVDTLSTEFSSSVIAGECKEAIEVNLAPGEVTMMDPPSPEDCIFLPSGTQGDRYRVTAVYPTTSSNANDVFNVRLAIVGDGVTGTPPAVAAAPSRSRPPSVRPSGDPFDLEQAMRVAEATERYHLMLREREREMLARIGTPSPLPRYAGNGGPHRGPARVPAKQRFDVSVSCGTTSMETALLLGEKGGIAIYQDSAQFEDFPVDSVAIQRMLDYYAAYGGRVIDRYFGGVSDINGDGVVVVLITPIVQQGFAAFVWGPDLWSEQDCPYSNRMEITYFSQSVAQGSGQALGTVVHEIKHVSSLYNRYVANGYHPGWIEEGTAEIAGEMSSRLAWAAAGGPEIGAMVRGEHLEEDGRTFENWAVWLRLQRMVWALGDQPHSLTAGDVYGSGWHFFRFLGDAYGNASRPLGDAPFFREQNASTSSGGVGWVEEKLDMDIGEVIERMGAAMTMDGTGAPLPQRGFFTTYDFSTAAEIFCNPNPLGVYPWPVTSRGTEGNCSGATEDSRPSVSFQSAVFEGLVGPGGVRVHDFVSNGTGRGSEIFIQVDPSVRILIARIR